MNATELVAKLSETHGVSKVQAKSIVDDFLKDIVDAAASGAEVSLPGFKVKATPEREGRNPPLPARAGRRRSEPRRPIRASILCLRCGSPPTSGSGPRRLRGASRGAAAPGA